MDNELEIIQHFIKLLEDDRYTFSTNEKNIFSFSYSFVSDAIIFFKGEPLIAVEIKTCRYNDFDYRMSFNQLQRYCISQKLSFGLVLWKESAILLVESDGFKEFEPIKIEDAAIRVRTRMNAINQPDINKLADQFLEKLKLIASGIDFQDKKAIDRIRSFTKDDLDWSKTERTPTTLTLSPVFEKKLFSAILGSYECEDICRYTTREGLFRILSNKKQSLCSIIGMNDKSECYYVDNYLLRWKGEKSDYLSYKENNLLNRCFITSCSRLDQESLEHKMYDDLTMWRMYAGDCKGVCIKFKIDRKKLGDKFILAPISYAKRQYTTIQYDAEMEEISGEESIHPELDFIHALMYCNEGGYEYRFPTIGFWKHFFKSYEYREEHEVRLMYFADQGENVKWIQANNVFCPIIEKSIEKDKSEYPLKLAQIVLGPKFEESEVNERQLEYIIHQEQIDCYDGFECVPSVIDNYR